MHKILLVLLLSFQCLYAQKDYQIEISKTTTAIKLDGILDEIAWQQAAEANSFYLNLPYDSSYAKADLQTSVRMLFDDNYIYISAVCKQKKEDIIISSLKRDFEGGVSDVFIVNFDPFKDHLNGFQFAVNPYGVQREGLIQEGAVVSNYWDNRWHSEVRVYDDHWIVEMAIPFKTLRYKSNESQSTWGINFSRMVLKYNQISTWKPVPRNFPPSNLAFTGDLIWTENPPKPGVNVSIIPYISANVSKEFPRNEATLDPLKTNSKSFLGVGLDTKISVTPSLNLDLTINPDFSQVEVDRQQTNLSRFELFFPERRQFFIENNDLFGQFGFPNTRPFFSRRIGITRNPNTGLNQRVPILAGARLSGKVNENWRIGLMNMQTRSVDLGEGETLPGTNYSVGVVQRKLFKRSTIGGIFANQQSIGNKSKEYSRVAGLELNISSNDSRFESESYFHASFTPEKLKDATSFAHYMGYNHPNFKIGFGALRIGENYKSDMGFVPRNGIWDLYRPVSVTFNPKSTKVSKYINSYGFGIDGSDVLTLKGKFLDSQTDFKAFVSNINGDEIEVYYGRAFTHLFYKYDPTNAYDNPNPDMHKNIVPLPQGDYRYGYYGIGYASSLRHKLYGQIGFKFGDYFNGKGNFAEINLSYRLQPYGLISVNGEYSKITLPKPFNSASYWLIGPKAEMAFTKSVFFSTFFQYNSQTNNTNINARLQWRFKPVSDFFLVYTENYFAEGIPNYPVNSWAPKDRALTMKITYWLNM